MKKIDITISILVIHFLLSIVCYFLRFGSLWSETIDVIAIAFLSIGGLCLAYLSYSLFTQRKEVKYSMVLASVSFIYVFMYFMAILMLNSFVFQE